MFVRAQKWRSSWQHCVHVSKKFQNSIVTVQFTVPNQFFLSTMYNIATISIEFLGSLSNSLFFFFFFSTLVNNCGLCCLKHFTENRDKKEPWSEVWTRLDSTSTKCVITDKRFSVFSFFDTIASIRLVGGKVLQNSSISHINIVQLVHSTLQGCKGEWPSMVCHWNERKIHFFYSAKGVGDEDYTVYKVANFKRYTHYTIEPNGPYTIWERGLKTVYKRLVR